MKRILQILAAALLATALLAPAAAQAQFGVYDFDVAFTDPEGAPSNRAGSHPFAVTTAFGVDFGAEIPEVPDGRLRDVFVELPEGFVADSTAYPRCSTADFATIGDGGPSCAPETVVGIAAAGITEPGKWTTAAVFNLPPPPGVLLRLGFSVLGTASILVDAKLSSTPPYRGVGFTLNAPETLDVFGSVTQLWGDPSDDAHDEFRGQCGLQNTIIAPGDIAGFAFENQSGESCPVEARSEPFLTLPTNCSVPPESILTAISWEGESDSETALLHDAGGNPEPLAGCDALGFGPSLSARPTSRSAGSPTGLDLSVEVEDEGLGAVGGTAHSQIRRVELTLPEGMTANPAIAEGLEVCSEAQLGRETLASAPGAGCPQASKLGTVEVQSPLVAEPIRGALYQAEPYDNLAGDSLIAFYFVLKNQKLGVLVKQPARVEPDPRTGQLVGITEQIPQLPFSSFSLRFREGARSPLVSPPRCGAHTARAVMTPWSGAPATEATSSFELSGGPNGGPCPPNGTLPFQPGLEAGSLNNAAGRYSPFALRLTRRDGDQDLTRFDAVLPPGVVAKLTGVVRCPDAVIAQAKSRDGRDELARPSCPAASRIGTVVGGAGVGSQLTYVSGSVHLAGPVGAAPLSVVGIVPAVAGPFDVGTIVVRQALDLDPLTGEARVDGALSDPIPHILAGIPLAVRDIQVTVDRPDFALNPTSCAELATRAGIWGGGSNVFSPHDDFPVLRQARYQAASCASLGFEPKLAIKLRGGTRRGAHPALRAHVVPRPGDANFSRAVVKLPTSAFLEQGHIRTICTRVQFAAPPGHGAHCPPGARYGFARAWSPLLDGPVTGPVFLRSSDNNLPDLVAALTGPPSAQVQVELSARIDSVKGGIRSIFSGIPDVPVSRFLLDMQGGKKGLIVNSRNLCRRPGRNRARANLKGQNGLVHRTRPVVRAAACARKGRKGARGAPLDRARGLEGRPGR